MASEVGEDLEKVRQYGENLANSADKSQNEADYLGLIAAATGSTKAKFFAANQIPRFFKSFPSLSAEGINAQLDLCEDDDVEIRIAAIRGLPFLCRDNSEHLPKIADVLGQLLIGDEQENAVVQNSLMQVLRQDPKESLSAIFKHIESSEDKLREKVLAFIQAKIIPNKNTILVPQKEMERHVTNLIKGIQDVTGEEFAMFLSFLTSLSIFGPSAAPERVQELVEIVEGQADLDASFEVSDSDHIERLLACLNMAIPFFARGGSVAKFLSFINRNVMPSFDQIAPEKQRELLKGLAEAAPFAAAADARSLLPSLTLLAKSILPLKKVAGEDMDIFAIEAVLNTFHLLASKAPNASNPLCGYKIVTGQPSDRLGEDFKEVHEDWLARLTLAEEEARGKLKAVMAEAAELNKKEKTAADDAAKAELKKKKTEASQLLKAAQNVEKLAKPLRAKTPSFLTPKTIPSASWAQEKPATNQTAPAGVARAAVQSALGGNKRPAAANGGSAAAAGAAGGGIRGGGRGGVGGGGVGGDQKRQRVDGRGGGGGWGGRGGGGRGRGVGGRGGRQERRRGRY